MELKEKPRCPVCGGECFVWAELQAGNFGLADESAAHLHDLFGVSHKFQARRCLGCSNIQLFVERPGAPLKNHE